MVIRVFVIDDHEIVRMGLRRMFEETEIQIAAEAAGGEHALRLVEHIQPDVIILDVRMQKGDGLRLLMEFKLQFAEIPVLIYSAFDNPVYIHQAIALSASGYLLKDTTRDELLDSIRKVAAGESIWRRDELRRVTGALATPRLDADVEVPLTQREGQVLGHLCEGLTNREIASRMEISYETVKEHVQHILTKIGVADRTQAAVWAVRNNLA